MKNAIEEIRAINKSIGEIGSFVKERTDGLNGDVSLLKEENERLKLDVGKLQERMRERRRAEVARADGMERGIRVREGRFAGHSPLDVGIMRVVAQNHRDDPDAPHARVWAEQLREATRSLRSGIGADDVDRHFQGMERLLRNAYVRESLPGTLARDPEMQYRQAVQPMLTHLRDLAVRAALDSTTAKAGDELVPTLERAELWMDVNLQTLVGGLIPVFPMPSQPFDIPTQLGDVNFFPGAENAAVKSSAPETGKVSLSAHELVAQVPFSFSLEEDNVLPSLLGAIRTSLVRNTAETLDDIILNADTTQTNNINADGASIRKDTAGEGALARGLRRADTPAADGTHRHGERPQRRGLGRYVQRDQGEDGPVRGSPVGSGLDHGREHVHTGAVGGRLQNDGQAGAERDAAERNAGRGGGHPCHRV